MEKGNLKKEDEHIVHELYGKFRENILAAGHKKYRFTFVYEVSAKTAWGDALWDDDVSFRNQISALEFEIGVTPEHLAEYYLEPYQSNVKIEEVS